MRALRLCEQAVQLRAQLLRPRRRRRDIGFVVPQLALEGAQGQIGIAE